MSATYKDILDGITALGTIGAAIAAAWAIVISNRTNKRVIEAQFHERIHDINRILIEHYFLEMREFIQDYENNNLSDNLSDQQKIEGLD